MRHSIDTTRTGIGARVAGGARVPALALVLFAALGAPAMAEAPVKGDWFGEAVPGPDDKPAVFAAAFLGALSPWVETLAFSPAGDECFVSVGNARYSKAKLFVTRRVDGVWTAFAEPTFAADFAFSHEPVYSADGSTLTFTGKRSSSSCLDLWVVRRSSDGWGLPEALPAPINSDADEYRARWMPDGSLYFGSTRSGRMKIYHAVKDGSGAWTATVVGAPIASEADDGDPCVAPDGRFLIFYSTIFPVRGSDLYISFADGAGGWGVPMAMGAAYNSRVDEYGACLSADGKYLFFTRHGPDKDQIFWVAVSAVDRFRK